MLRADEMNVNSARDAKLSKTDSILNFGAVESNYFETLCITLSSAGNIWLNQSRYASTMSTERTHGSHASVTGETDASVNWVVSVDTRFRPEVALHRIEQKTCMQFRYEQVQ